MKTLLVILLFPIVCSAEKIDDKVIQRFSEFIDDLGAIEKANVDGFKIDSVSVDQVDLNTDIEKPVLSDERMDLL